MARLLFCRDRQMSIHHWHAHGAVSASLRVCPNIAVNVRNVLVTYEPHRYSSSFAGRAPVPEMREHHGGSATRTEDSRRNYRTRQCAYGTATEPPGLAMSRMRYRPSTPGPALGIASSAQCKAH